MRTMNIAMKIRRKYVLTAVWIAMLSLFTIQIFQVLQLYDRKSDDYRAKLKTALERIALKHERLEDVHRFSEIMNRDVSNQYKDVLKEEFKNLFEVKESISIRDTTILENGELRKYLVVTGIAYDSITGMTSKQDVLARDVRQIRQLFEKGKQQVMSKDSVKAAYHLDQRVMHKLIKKAQYINDLMVQTYRDNVYIEPKRRIDLKLLDSLIRHELEEDKLPVDFQFVITEENNEKVRFDKSLAHYKMSIDTSKTEIVNLFPNKILEDRLFMHIDFPKSDLYVLRSMGSLLYVSITLMVLIFFAIIFLLRTILGQEKLSEIKNDFISNMTHEFKTPISTISLACEALNDDDMMGEKSETAAPFVKMIADENQRLSNLVEAILQSANLDKGEIKVKNEKIDLKEIIQDVVKTASFRIAGLNGELRLNLPETPVYVFADKMHTTNLVNNLVDNAIKYSKNEIDISVHLEKIGNRAEFSVSDKGIGIKREHISKIFDKLYRVPMGNLHNVKGFGLGLSYVKVIAERFGWTLNVKSQYGVGSTFTVVIKNTL